jgi:hypothetical protein
MRIVDSVWVFRTDVSREQFEELRRAFADRIEREVLKLEKLPEDDPTLLGVCNLLRSWGLQLVFPNDVAPYETGQKFVRVWRYREYDDAELDACELLEPVVPRSAWVKGDWFVIRGKEGESLRMGGRFIEKRSIPKGVHIVGYDNGGMCCLDSVKQQLEPQNFTGLQFVPLAIAKKIPFSDDFEDAPWKGPPWWYVSSSVRMPSCVPPNYTARFGKRVLPREFPQGTPGEPGFTDCERHYARSEIAPLGPFDVARNGENPNMDSTTVIVSNRFYRFCRERKFHIGFRPVRIHEGE